MLPRTWLPLALWILLSAAAARADPAFQNADENVVDDRVADGELDAEDLAARRDGLSGSTDGRESWVSLVGFARPRMFGQSNVGGMVVVGLALDGIVVGGLRTAESSRPLPTPRSPPDAPFPAATNVALVAPSLARECVAAALRASGLGVDDLRIDALVSRARASAWLPETRMRAMRLMTDTARATTLTTSDGTSYYDTVGAHLVLELRLTWRFDRLVFGGDEPALERMRLERQEARSRMAGRTLDVLFAWQRAAVDARAAAVGSEEELAARLRASESLATLDVLTDGWFSRRRVALP